MLFLLILAMENIGVMLALVVETLVGWGVVVLVALAVVLVAIPLVLFHRLFLFWTLYYKAWSRCRINSSEPIPSYLPNDFPTFFHHSPLSIAILNTLIPQGMEIPKFEKYGGKGDPQTHVSTFNVMCMNFFHHDALMDKFFPRYLKDTSLEWYCSLLNNSIFSFDQLVN